MGRSEKGKEWANELNAGKYAQPSAIVKIKDPDSGRVIEERQCPIIPTPKTKNTGGMKDSELNIMFDINSRERWRKKKNK